MLETLAPILNFFFVVAIFYFGGRKGFVSMLSSRAESVGKEMSEAERDFGLASKALSENESNYRNREANARREMEEAKTVSVRHREKTINSARDEAERIKLEAKMTGSNEIENAKLHLQKELAEKSLLMASQYFDKQLDAKDKEMLVQEYIELVGHGFLSQGGV